MTNSERRKLLLSAGTLVIAGLLALVWMAHGHHAEAGIAALGATITLVDLVARRLPRSPAAGPDAPAAGAGAPAAGAGAPAGPGAPAAGPGVPAARPLQHVAGGGGAIYNIHDRARVTINNGHRGRFEAALLPAALVTVALAASVFGLGFLRARWDDGPSGPAAAPPTGSAGPQLPPPTGASRPAAACGDGTGDRLVRRVVRDPFAQCIGFSDRADAVFGGDEDTVAAQRDALAKNTQDGRAYDREQDLTLVWLGALTCAGKDPHCPGRHYLSEQEELHALQAYARHANADPADAVRDVHLVVANAGQDMEHAEAVAQLIVDERDRFGRRLAVVGGGDSREQTRRAIGRFLDAGIPVVAPTLTAVDPDRPFDPAHPAAPRPFVAGAGYVQLVPGNDAYAVDLVGWLATLRRLDRHQGRALVVYSEDDPKDYYTRTLTEEVERVAGDAGLTVERVTGLGRLDTSICADAATPPKPVVFADRWTRFAGGALGGSDFVRRVTELCRGRGGPYLVVGDGSVNRVLNDDTTRRADHFDGATWGLAYYSSGAQCSELLAGPAGAKQPVNAQAAALLKVTNRELGIDCTGSRASDQLGNHVAPMWDAAVVADALLDGRTQELGPGDLGSLSPGPVQVSQGEVTVRYGTVTSPLPIVRTCTLHFNGLTAAAPGTARRSYVRDVNLCGRLVPRPVTR